MIAFNSEHESKSEETLHPFSKERYLENVKKDKWCPSSQFSYDHLTTQEIASLAHLIEYLAFTLLGQSETILKEVYPRVLTEVGEDGEASYQDMLLQDIRDIFMETGDKLEVYALMMIEDAFNVRRQIVLREWDVVSQRMESATQAFLEGRPEDLT